MGSMSEADLYEAMVAYEDGELDEAGTVRMFQHLVNSGDAWRLNGHYGRTAMDLIEAGLVTRTLH